jgi:CheY-like chemotaxis protein
MTTDDTSAENPSSRKLIVVDDLPEAGHLVSKLLRRANYEVAVLADLPATTATLAEFPDVVAGIVASFSTAGTGACLRLLDALRSHLDPRLHELRVLLISDQSRQQIFCLQAGADGILLRPFTDTELVVAVEEMVLRPESDRIAYRRRMVDQIKADASRENPFVPQFETATATAKSAYF